MIFNYKTTDRLQSIAQCLQKNGRFVQMSKLAGKNPKANKFPIGLLHIFLGIEKSIRFFNVCMFYRDSEKCVSSRGQFRCTHE